MEGSILSLDIGLSMTGFGIMSVIGGRLSGKIANIIGPLRVLWSGFFTGCGS